VTTVPKALTPVKQLLLVTSSGTEYWVFSVSTPKMPREIDMQILSNYM
jgi:hypothetical protein